MSRGTAMSMSTSGRPSRTRMTSARSSASTIGCGEEVEETTMSACSRRAGQRVQRADLAAEALGQRARAVGVAVGDEDGPHALVDQRLGRQLGRLAGADDDHRARLEVADDVAGEVDGHARDADALARDAGLRAHALAGLQRGAEQAVGHRPGGAGLERRLVGAADLALDLGLADDHRVQAGGHAVELARGVAVARRVDDRRELGRPDVGPAGELAQQLGLRAHGSAVTR